MKGTKLELGGGAGGKGVGAGKGRVGGQADVPMQTQQTICHRFCHR